MTPVPDLPLPKDSGNPWLLALYLIIMLLGTVIGGAGGVEMIRAFTRRKPKKTIEVGNQIELAKQAQLYAQQLEEDARQARESEQKAWAEARLQAAAAWQQAEETQRKLVQVNRQLNETMYIAVEMGRYMEALFTKVKHPATTIEDVREWVDTVPPPRVGKRHHKEET